jgi:hypothetical protein
VKKDEKCGKMKKCEKKNEKMWKKCEKRICAQKRKSLLKNV